MQCFNCNVHQTGFAVTCNRGYSLGTFLSLLTSRQCTTGGRKVSKQTENPQNEESRAQRGVSSISISRVGIKPICPYRCKLVMIWGKGTVIATVVKERAIPMWHKCFKSRPVLDKPRGYVFTHSLFIHKRSLNQQAKVHKAGSFSMGNTAYMGSLVSITNKSIRKQL